MHNSDEWFMGSDQVEEDASDFTCAYAIHLPLKRIDI